MTEIRTSNAAPAPQAPIYLAPPEHLNLVHRMNEVETIGDLMMNGEHDAALYLQRFALEQLRKMAREAGWPVRRCWHDLTHHDARVAAAALQATEHAVSDASESAEDRAAASSALARASKAPGLRGAPPAERAASIGLRLVEGGCLARHDDAPA
jgi:hypothetical protein